MIKTKRDAIEKAGSTPAPTSGKKKKKKKKKQATEPSFRSHKDFLAHLDRAADAAAEPKGTSTLSKHCIFFISSAVVALSPMYASNCHRNKKKHATPRNALG